MSVSKESTCDICNQPSIDGLFTCLQCGNEFCELCGDPAEQICDYCQETESFQENEETDQPENIKFKKLKTAVTPGQTHF
jgi:predicted ATP-dependent serine protease